MPREPEPQLCVAFQKVRLSTHRHHLTRSHLIMPSAPPQLPHLKMDSLWTGRGIKKNKENGAVTNLRSVGQALPRGKVKNSADRAGEPAFDEVETVLAPEHLVADEEHRGAEHAAFCRVAGNRLEFVAHVFGIDL